MRFNNRGIRRPLTYEEFSFESAPERNFGGKEVDNVVQEISLDKMSLEERRKEAKKPLYLVRYE
jgi:hypothetical protein